MKDIPKPTMAEIMAQNERLKLDIERLLSQNLSLYAENKELKRKEES